MFSENATEQTLVSRARLGDQDAWRILLRRHVDGMRSRIRSRLSPALLRKASLADVVQEACIVASQRIHEFQDRGDGSFARWLGKIAENCARKIVEHYAGTAKRRVGREISRNGRPDTHQFLGNEASPSQHAMASELRVAAASAS